MKLSTLIFFLAVMMQASSQSPMTIERISPNPWITPLDLNLGQPTSLTAGQIFDSVFSLRSEVRNLTSNQGDSYIVYTWFARNSLDRALSLAVVHSPPSPINPQGLGRVYGATWAGVSPGFNPVSTTSLYGVRIKSTAGWTYPEDRPDIQSPFIKWLHLEPKQEHEIHRAYVPASEPIEVAVFSVPFQMDELQGEAFLCYTIP